MTQAERIQMICPKCKSTNIRTERSPNGEIKCNDCDFVIKKRGSNEEILTITESKIKWVLGSKISGRPTSTDLLEYAEELLQDEAEMVCCVGDTRVPKFKKIGELLERNKSI